MFKFLIIFLTSIFILSGCNGCSFIKEKLGIKQIDKSQQQRQEQYQDESQRRSEPIPVNPQHS